MSDQDIVRLVPLYRAVKDLHARTMTMGSVFEAIGQLENLVERAIMTDGTLVPVQTKMAIDNLMAAAERDYERAKAIKAILDEVVK